VTETGWGEFQLNIRIVFQDATQKPLNFTHHLMLYPTEEANQVKTSRPVISEHYEEIIFDPPTELMANILKQEPQYVDPKTSPRYAECKSYPHVKLTFIDEKLEREELLNLEAAIASTIQQIEEIEEKTATLTSSGVMQPDSVPNSEKRRRLKP
jgi:YEATS domain-containing protein 4